VRQPRAAQQFPIGLQVRKDISTLTDDNTKVGIWHPPKDSADASAAAEVSAVVEATAKVSAVAKIFDSEI
jgi:hypothetical protein